MEFSDLTLQWDDFHWCGTIMQSFFEGMHSSVVELHVETKDEEEMPPHNAQVGIYQTILDDSDLYLEKILAALFIYYNKMRPQYVQAGDEWAKNMPAISKPEELKSMLRLNIIQIDWPFDGTPIVGFSFRCQWDPEHGVGIVFKGNEQIDIGGADCLYNSH